MTDYEWCKKAYDNGWATAEMLQIWVNAGRLTQEEYSEIVG
ncbi:MAG: XkdX family protein [Maledivibacter sp.]|jgi:hypothetical protein|nr:XkdX family protein [Maledivibacter sp.]